MSLFFPLLLLFSPLHAFPSPRGYLLNCGSAQEILLDGQDWIPDEGFVSTGNISAVHLPDDVYPTLSTVRYFPGPSTRKYCYTLPVIRGSKYLLRSTYFYGGFDGGDSPPVFDQIIDGTKWSTVDTREDYARNLSSYYEIVVAAAGKSISFCLSRNNRTLSDPFVSSVELNYLDDGVYNSTDFRVYALATVARHVFGHDGGIISYPDDEFNRLWQPFADVNPIVKSHSTVKNTNFWNLPPPAVFSTAVTTSRGKTLELEWPPGSLPDSKYYVSLYFKDNRTPSPFSWRVFNVSINGRDFYTRVNATTAGVVVCGDDWPLSGKTRVTLVPDYESPVGPVINAGEVLQMIPLGGRTHHIDFMAMEDLARSLYNPPADWKGDPCLPSQNSWSGVTCSTGKHIHVVGLNLTNAGLSGSLPSSLGNLTHLKHIWLGGNKLSGTIPDLGNLTELQTLHLEDNMLSGSIPEVLGNLEKLHEIYLQHNKLQDAVPLTLQRRNKNNFKIFF